MYKIYINENALLIGDKDEIRNLNQEGVKVIPFFMNKKGLLNYVDKLEKSPDGITIALSSDQPEEIFKLFKSLYRIVNAAGGVVRNENGEVLFIERLDFWDLPKGKLDPGEKWRAAAIREVREETGQKCKIDRKIANTWHTYEDRKGRRVLKKTKWYTMTSRNPGQVVVQAEEQITGYKWMTMDSYEQIKGHKYRSIDDLVRVVAQSQISTKNHIKK